MCVCMYVCMQTERGEFGHRGMSSRAHTHTREGGGGEGEGGRGRVVLGEVAGELGAVKQSARLERLVDVLSTSYLC